MNYPCKKCYLRYSSYCIGCRFSVYGIYGDKPTEKEIEEVLKDDRRKGLEGI